ncbi:PLP-dependent aminotransferase family protein [Dyella humi]|uniref:aminotransferase-like domain-containing protein n=1 Tax=Dyella humi TaxID=1770547 RepID=UPI00360EC782
MNFLNEIMQRYPHAISFAPGAPYPVFLESIDVQHYMDVFAESLKSSRHLSPAQIQRCLHQYGPAKGLINDIVARLLHRDEQLIVDAASIVITVGCQEAMLLLLRALRSDPNDQLAVVTPCYVGLIGAARLVEFDVVPIDECDSGIDLKQLRHACCEARAAGKRLKAVYVAPDHSNPSGTQMSDITRAALLDLAAELDFLIIEDNTYRFTSADESYPPLIKSLDRQHRVILLGTFAKTCTPGARVGYVVADQPIRSEDGRKRLFADELAALKTMVTVNTSPICQALIGGMLIAHEYSIRQLAQDKTRKYRKNLDCLLTALDEHLGDLPHVAWNRPNGGFFVRLRLPVPVDESLMALSAEQFGVLWTPMSHFHIDGRVSHELRLSCSYLSEQQIEEGMGRLSRFLHHLTTPLSAGMA